MEMQRGTITVLDYSTGEIQIEVAHGLSAEARKRGKYRPGGGHRKACNSTNYQ